MTKLIIKKTNKNIWYKNGLSFECQQCGKCCSGEPGYIWVDKQEIAKIANRLNITEDRFIEDYTYQEKGKLSIKERSNGDCILLDKEKKCLIYDIRPTQCKTWPWWEQNLESREQWDNCEGECEGINQGEKKNLQYIISELEKDNKAIQ